MTLQERLRRWPTKGEFSAAREAADVLDAKDKRIAELEVALRECANALVEILLSHRLDPNPKFCEEVFRLTQSARAALGDK